MTLREIKGDDVTLDMRCNRCGKVYSLTVRAADYLRYLRGTESIRNVFPRLQPSLRELLVSGVCPRCRARARSATGTPGGDGHRGRCVTRARGRRDADRKEADRWATPGMTDKRMKCARTSGAPGVGRVGRAASSRRAPATMMTTPRTRRGRASDNVQKSTSTNARHVLMTGKEIDIR